jgi:hypothetical protein
MNCLVASSCCAAFVVVVFQQPTQKLVADDFVEAELTGKQWWRQICVDGYITEPLMGAVCMIIDQPTFEDVPEMAFSEDNKVVQDLCASSTHPRLGHRICSSRRLLLIAGMKSELFG